MEGRGKRVNTCTVQYVTVAVYDTVVVRYVVNGMAKGGLAAGGKARSRLAWQRRQAKSTNSQPGMKIAKAHRAWRRPSAASQFEF